MNHDRYDDAYIHGLLNAVQRIAVVGVSANPSRPSYVVFKYLLERGYRVIPVNPGLAGQHLLGQTTYASLADIREPVDMVDIFRASQHVLPIVVEALQMLPQPRVVWMQLGLRNDEAAEFAEANGMNVVMNRCPKIEYGRLSSDISSMGVNSRTPRARRLKPPARGVELMSLEPGTAGSPAIVERTGDRSDEAR